MPIEASVAIAVFATAVLSGVFGMAGGLILMGIYLLLFDVPTAMMLHGATQLASNGSRALLLYRSIEWARIAFYLLGAMTMFLVFSLLVVSLDKGPTFILLGLLPLIPKRAGLSFAKRSHAAICGMIVTTGHLTAGVSGPLLDVFFLDGKWDRYKVIATKAFTQTFAHSLKLVYFGWIVAESRAATAGEAEGEVTLLLYAIAVVCALLGTGTGRMILDRVTDRQFLHWSRRLVIVLCLVYLIRGIWMVAGGGG